MPAPLTDDAASARAAARRRHPSARWLVPVRTLCARVSERLRAGGAEHADIAAALLHARGVTGLDLETFAARAGVDVEALARAEGGDVAWPDLPPVLRMLVRGDVRGRP